MDSIGNDLSYLKATNSNNEETSSTKSPIENRNLKHFKKSMIVEYESGNLNEDSHSSSASSHSELKHNTSKNHEDDPTRAGKSSEPVKHKLEFQHKAGEQRKKSKLDDVFENENSSEDDDNYEVNDEDDDEDEESSSYESRRDEDDSNESQHSRNKKKKADTDLPDVGNNKKSSKLDKKDKKKTYCVCKSSDTLRFMM